MTVAVVTHHEVGTLGKWRKQSLTHFMRSVP